jgi:LysM repeat protein
MHTGENVMQVSQRNQSSDVSETTQTAIAPAALLSVPTDGASSAELEPQEKNLPAHVSVSSGDTLWNIAQRYHVTVEHLRAFNRLTDNKIIIGQLLRLPDGRPLPVGGADKGTSMP